MRLRGSNVFATLLLDDNAVERLAAVIDCERDLSVGVKCQTLLGPRNNGPNRVRTAIAG